MKYKYKKGQIFGKKLKVTKNILNKIYNQKLSINEYFGHNLYDKIPITCIKESERKTVEKFGLEKLNQIDWEDIFNNPSAIFKFDFNEVLEAINPETNDINHDFYEIYKDMLSPAEYSPKMKEIYSNRLFDIDFNNGEGEINDLKYDFNYGEVNLKKILNNWDLFKDKDLNYCLSKDESNTYNITSDMLKDFMSKYSVLTNIITNKNNYDNNDNSNDIYSFISFVMNSNSEEEKKQFIKKYTDNILSNTYRSYNDNKEILNLSNQEYIEIFKYSSLEDYLKIFNHGYELINLFNELKQLPKDYIFSMTIPFKELLSYNVLQVIETYGLKNIAEFDKECGHFFSSNNCEMLKNMFEMYLKYAKNEIDRSKIVVDYLGKGNAFIDGPYTKDEFYEALRRMIIYGPKNPNFENITGEFRNQNNNLFISENAPEELKKMFYEKSITPKILFKNPDYIPFLKGKKIESCFKSKSIHVDGSKSPYLYENFYNFISNKINYNGLIVFLLEYSDVLDIVLNETDMYDIKVNDDINIIKNKFIITLRDIIIKKGIPYPSLIPDDFIKIFPSMFLDKNAPQELQEAFYGRNNTLEIIQMNPEYKNFLNNIDLEVLFKYMPVNIKNNDNRKINLIKVLKQTFSEKEILDIIIKYGSYIERLYDINSLNGFVYNPELSKEEQLNVLDELILNNIINGNLQYNENAPEHFKINNATLFLGTNIPLEIKNKFYNRKFTLEDFNNNPKLLNFFDNTNIACAFNKEFSWIIPLFNDSKNIKTGNYKRMKVILAYSKIQDVELQKAFKEYMIESSNDIYIEKIEYASEVIQKLSLSNSKEVFIFRKELARQILKSDNPLDSLNKIEEVFIKNNIPTVGKIYSCFEILHPDFKGFDFNNNYVSPVLQNSSTLSKKIIVFTDLIKSAFGSNNRSVNMYLKNIEQGSYLYKKIKSGQIQYDSLSENEQKELTTFCSHLATIYNNTMNAKKNNEIYTSSGNVLEDILELSKRLSPDGTLDYNLEDRVIKMFCGFAGIETLEQAKEYINKSVKTADIRNRNAAKNDLKLEKGDLIKGIGDITYLKNILQNGSVSKEYLGSSASSDSTPLDTDLSMIIKGNGTIYEKIEETEAKTYGPIWFVLKNDDRFIITRNKDRIPEPKRDMSKMELFYTGIIGNSHYGIRTGFASSEINYIVMDNYDPRVGLEIAMNGFYIPVANKEGKIVFTPKDYDELRSKMSGLSYYGENNYSFSENLITEETKYFVEQIEQNNSEVKEKKEKINSVIKKALEELGLHLKTNIDGDLTEGFVELIDTGSTGRGTNKPGDGDFDFMMRLDKTIISNPEILNKLKQTILRNLGKENSSELTGTGDFRLKSVPIDTDMSVDIDITFTEKTDKVSYSTDMALQDRLATIQKNDSEKYKYVVANILLAKQILKKAEAYKPNRGENPQGGLGGVGIENWILQNGGSFVEAAKNFVKAADGKSFSEFKSTYKIWNFGENHLAERRNLYIHNDFISDNMSESGYKKMVHTLKEYLNSLENKNTFVK